ncbi:aminopeptidase N [Salinibius halmophilus]|uniref:aminopeptidase N n=1 Tax=Salinibius halmophilus TaxID=1853216 RepID=UPI000E673438|nr:aminopeptidase N [Salinibius halmophilus]
MSAQPKEIFLKDYQPSAWNIDHVDLLIQIFEEETVVTSNLRISRNPDGPKDKDLVLHGADLEYVATSIDGDERILDENVFIEDETLRVKDVPDAFLLNTVVRIYPEKNTSLEGLYKSGGMYCTQCEAEGFRKITWYLDRPDVLSIFNTRIEADKELFPVLLANGNEISRGDIHNGRHYVAWKDPHKKPAYLFATVAGKLEKTTDTFTTMSGKEVKLELFVEPHNLSKTDFAMGALKRSFKWDEERFGREYDLDIFMVVATDHFNMGAMENKGLNIFNSAAVLANEKTSTDADFERIEAIVGHEYFHNWSGNRVTCRDWFQLSLKEGFTVFRDAEFTADLHSRPIKRIDDVNMLRSAQFPEDAGPTAHPVRPQSFIEINNFYTLTIYEKGAEVVRMIHTLLGEENFRKGSDLYFDRFDGQAVTTEDFVACMEEVSGIDLTQFKLWYDFAGTPVVTIKDDYDATTGTYKLTAQQMVPDTPGQTNKPAFHIPVKLGLLAESGENLTPGSNDTNWDAKTGVWHLRDRTQTIEFTGLKSKPVPSLLRDFSAPVKLNYNFDLDQLALLAQNDANAFNRWDAVQRFTTQLILAAAEAGTEISEVDERLLKAYEQILADENIDNAIRAALLTLPSRPWLAEQVDSIDPIAINDARQSLRVAIAKAMAKPLRGKLNSIKRPAKYEFKFQDVAARRLRAVLYAYLALVDDKVVAELEAQYKDANNYSEQNDALQILNEVDDKASWAARLEDFIKEWGDDAQMIEAWLSLNSTSKHADLAHITKMLKHEKFDKGNPNRVRRLIGAFAMNNIAFHAKDGSGYKFLAEQVIDTDARNPQLASRMIVPLTRWKRYAEQYAGEMRSALELIAEVKSLSPDCFEMVSKSLK